MFPPSASCRVLQDHVSILSVLYILPPFPPPVLICNSLSNIQIFGSARGLHYTTIHILKVSRRATWPHLSKLKPFLGSLASGSHQQLWTASVHQDPSEEMRMLRESHSIVLLPFSNEPVALGAERWPEIFLWFQHGGGSSSSRTKYLPCKPRGQQNQNPF